MKKRLSMMAAVLCAVMMVGGLSVTAYAGGGDEYTEPTEQWEGLDPVEETPAPTIVNRTNLCGQHKKPPLCRDMKF